MCYFITVAVLPKHAARAVAALDPAVGISPQHNASLARAIGGSLTSMFTLSKSCCCGYYSPPVGDKDEHLRKKYAKKGWSAAKIERAIASAAQGRWEGLADVVRESVAALADEAGQVALLVHWYGGGVDEEIVTPGDAATLTPEQLRQGDPLVQEDRLYIVKAAKSGQKGSR